MLSGDRRALGEIADELARREVFCRWVKVDVASHSPQMDALRDDLLKRIDGVSGQPPRIPMYSTVTGEPIDTSTLDAGYWFRNLRQTVRFEDAVRALLADGHGTFVECSPHPVLTIGVQQLVDDQDVIVTGSLRRDTGLERMLESIAEVHVRGGAVDWSAFVPKGHRVALPTYPFDREDYWLVAGSTGDA
ncbi:acyltransferase domain-containing protein, partial [Kibdelosporangium lantanae]